MKCFLTIYIAITQNDRQKVVWNEKYGSLADHIAPDYEPPLYTLACLPNCEPLTHVMFI